MASTPKTTYNSSDSSMSGWIAFSVVGHLVLLLILSTIAPQVFSKKQTPLQQKQIATQQRVYEEQNKQQLQQKMQRMDKAYNELVEHRNKRVQHYLQLEEQMQARVATELPQQAEEAIALQQKIERAFPASGAAFDSLQHLQKQIQQSIKDEHFDLAAQQLLTAHHHLQKLNTDIEKLCSDVQESNVRLDNMRELLQWFNNDSLVQKLENIKNLQNQVQKDLTTSHAKLNRYAESFDKKMPNIQKDVDNLTNTKKSRFKTWALKRRMAALAKKDISKRHPENNVDKQKEVRQQLDENLKKAEATLKLGLPHTPFAQRQPQSGSKQQDMSGMAQEAQERCGETAQVFQEARAAELALLQNKSYNSAYQQISESSQSFNDDRPYDFPEDISSARDFNDYKKSFDLAARDMDLILADIQAMRQKAMETRTSLSDSGLTDVRLAMRRQVSERETLAERAGPQGQQVQDLSRDMFLMKHPQQSISFSSHTGNTPPAMRLSTEHYGRKISSHGKPVKSFYLNSWYMIGPFPNSRRTHIDDVFPPETIIDLDAEYVGKHGPMHWEYCSSSTHFIKPVHFDEYAIYYAYTELYSEEDTAVWMAFGSDDRLDVWINDIKVWQSSNRLKQWQPNEGFRKVYLQQGYNKILARLENGYRECGFSVIVALQ